MAKKSSGYGAKALNPLEVKAVEEEVLESSIPPIESDLTDVEECDASNDGEENSEGLENEDIENNNASNDANISNEEIKDQNLNDSLEDEANDGEDLETADDVEKSEARGEGEYLVLVPVTSKRGLILNGIVTEEDFHGGSLSIEALLANGTLVK